MKITIISFLFIILCSCKTQTNWHYGTWQLAGMEIRKDQIKSDEHKQELEAIKMFSGAFTYGEIMTIGKDQIKTERQEFKQSTPYKIVSEEDNKLTVETEAWGKIVFLRQNNLLINQSDFFHTSYKRIKRNQNLKAD